MVNTGAVALLYTLHDNFDPLSLRGLKALKGSKVSCF